MKICLTHISNARDIGGIPVQGGVVANGRLWRSGEHSRMSDSDMQTLLQLGLTRVVDLRTDKEMANVPDRQVDGVVYEHIPIIEATTFGISYETSDGPTIAKHLEAGIQRMRLRGETPAEHMQELYQRFAVNEFCRKQIGQFVRALANKPHQGATLWHCSAGKDRVGVCTATLLYCLGASKQDILKDYMLTNTLTEQSSQSILNKVAPFVSDEKLDLVHKMLTVDESYITNFFATCTQLYGSFDNYLTLIGVTESDKQKLHDQYVVAN